VADRDQSVIGERLIQLAKTHDRPVFLAVVEAGGTSPLGVIGACSNGGSLSAGQFAECLACLVELAGYLVTDTCQKMEQVNPEQAKSFASHFARAMANRRPVEDLITESRSRIEEKGGSRG
jgi:hypothetical protein